jgi:hypothetical protein
MSSSWAVSQSDKEKYINISCEVMNKSTMKCKMFYSVPETRSLVTRHQLFILHLHREVIRCV